jgi:hypothetical protein
LLVQSELSLLSEFSRSRPRAGAPAFEYGFAVVT